MTKRVFVDRSIAYPKWSHFSFIQFDIIFLCHNKLIRKSAILPQGFTCNDLYHTHFHHIVERYAIQRRLFMGRDEFYTHTVHYFNGYGHKTSPYNQDNHTNWINTLLELLQQNGGILWIKASYGQWMLSKSNVLRFLLSRYWLTDFTFKDGLWATNDYAKIKTSVFIKMLLHWNKNE